MMIVYPTELINNVNLPKFFKVKTVSLFNRKISMSYASFECGGYKNIKSLYFAELLKVYLDYLNLICIEITGN